MRLSANISALSLAIAAALVVPQISHAGGRSDLVLADLQAGRAHTGELLVQFRSGVSRSDSEAVRSGLRASTVSTVRSELNGRLELMRLPAGLAVADAVRGLSGDPAVEFAEPNWTYQHSATSNDTYVTNGSLWGMSGTYGSQAVNAWSENKQNCSGVYIGVIDEGIYFAHEDLTANIWTNPYDPVDGIDNDGNGYVDDTRGWDFDGNSNDINSGGATDDHGTHVSGTIAGIGGNGKGVAGVCWGGVKLISGKFLGRRGGTTADAIQAVDYFNDLKSRHGLNIVATNNSWGGGGYSQALKDAIDRANTAGILFVAAAGNSAYDNDTQDSYPSNYTSANVIAVASTTSTGALSSFSQWGAATVDLGAPGSAIWSTVPKTSKGKLISGYASYNGTSMATPHVTGAAALYASLNPGASAAQIKAAILGGTVATPSLSGKVVTGGRLDVSGF